MLMSIVAIMVEVRLESGSRSGLGSGLQSGSGLGTGSCFSAVMRTAALSPRLATAMVLPRVRVRVGVRVRVRVRCFGVTRRHQAVLCVRQRCERTRYRSCIWAAAGREGVQHTDGDAGWRLRRHGSFPNLD